MNLTVRRTLYLERGTIALVVIFFAVGLHRLFITNINWDEFYYLSFVHLYRGGELALHWQTFHVHFFAWLPWISESEVQQVFAARGVVWVINLASTWLIYRIAGRFSNRLGALLAAALYLSFSFVMDHGTSFRADPFCALFFLVAVHLLINRMDWPYAAPIAAIAMALAVMVSLKSVFYVPTIAVLLAASLLNRSERLAALRRVAVFVFSFAVAFAVLFIWHSRTLAPVPLADSGAYAAIVGGKTLGGGDLFPAWPFVRRALADNPLTWVLIACGLWIAGQNLISGRRRAESLTILSLALPLLSLVVYRNAFPYFFVFLVPGAIIPAAIAINHLAARGGAAFAAVAAILVVVAAAYTINYAKKLPDQTVAQAETVRLVHAMFPEPVPYIDRNSMIGSFPKAGFFMSTWGMESYRASMRPIMADLLAQKTPPLLIANTSALDIAGSALSGNKASPYKLFPEDFKLLRENYVHHWGAIYVAGKSLVLPADGEAQAFEIMVPGTYTVEAAGSIEIDGEQLAPGADLTLTLGLHSAKASMGRARQATLRWGRDLYLPARPPSPQPIYTGF